MRSAKNTLKSMNALSRLAVGGIKAYDDSTAGNAYAILRIVRTLCPDFNETMVCLDLGHGAGRFVYALAEFGFPSLGIEIDTSLHHLAKAAGLVKPYVGSVAFRCLPASDVMFEGVNFVFQYEAMAGTVDMELDVPHMNTTAKMMSTKTISLC